MIKCISYTAKRDIKWKNHELVWKQNFKYWINLENLKKLLTLLIIMFFLQTNLRPLKNFCLFFKWSQIGFGFLSLSFLSSKTFDSQMLSLNWKFKEEDQMHRIFGRIGNSRETLPFRSWNHERTSGRDEMHFGKWTKWTHFRKCCSKRHFGMHSAKFFFSKALVLTWRIC